jgi:hypothetical protein
LDEHREFKFSLVETPTVAKRFLAEPRAMKASSSANVHPKERKREREREREMICETQHQKRVLSRNQSAHTINFDNGQFLLWQRCSQTLSCETKDICQKRSDQKAQM